MSLSNSVLEINEPYQSNVHPEIKTFGELSSLITTTTRRQNSTSKEPSTIIKACNTMISSILLNSGFDGGNNLLDGVIGIIIFTLKAISISPNIEETLKGLISEIEGKQRNSALSVHRTTIDNMLPKFSRKEADLWLANNYLKNMEELSRFKAKSKYVTLCVDETPETIHSKYQNGNFQYIHVGQKSTWEKGFEYSCVYDATHQLHLGCIHEDKFFTSTEKRQVRPWLRILQEKIFFVHQAGSDVKVIECDRGYFQAEAFAMAYLGILDENVPIEESPRFIIPRKFSREKDTYKWDYLIDVSKPQVFEEYIRLDPYTHPALKNLCAVVFERTDDYRYKIPYACIALIDEYSTKKNRNFDEVRIEAISIQKELELAKIELKQAEKRYLQYSKKLQKKNPSKPSYGRGKKRTKFNDSIDKSNYESCFTLHEQLQILKEKKKELLCSLMFISVSIRPDEDPTKSSKKFIKLAKDYHDRWGIERGFEDVKGKFMRDARSRKPTRRQFNIMLGMCLCNNWHVERMELMLKKYRNTVWNKVPWVPNRPWTRRRLEKEYGDSLSADSYLILIWKEGIKLTIKKIISQFY